MILKMKVNPILTDPIVTEHFSNTDNALLISYARQIHSIVAVGGNLKLLNQSIFEYSGNGFGIDIGIILTPYKGLRFGTMLLDATGTQIRWDTADKPTFTRGRRLRFGGAYQFTFPSFGKGSIGADFETDQGDLEEGTEYRRRTPLSHWGGILALQHTCFALRLERTWIFCWNRTPIAS